MKILYLPNEYSQQRQREKKRWIYPVLLAMEAQSRIQQGHEVVWDKPGTPADKIVTEPEGLPFLSLPWPDRAATNAFDKKYQENGNFKYRPGTYIQAASGCWHGRCTFCVERFNKWQVRRPLDVYNEILYCKWIGFKEIFDDSGTFPTGPWLDEFLSFPPPGVTLGCNMRMVDAPYKRMKDWGFRMVLFGVESANQSTLDKINKGVKIEDFKYIEKASSVGLDTHTSFMFGYPWETESDAKNTLRVLHYMLRKGIAKTAQASFYQSSETGFSVEAQRRYVKALYQVALFPDFWFNKIKGIKSKEDVGYLLRQIKEGLKRG